MIDGSPFKPATDAVLGNASMIDLDLSEVQGVINGSVVEDDHFIELTDPVLVQFEKDNAHIRQEALAASWALAYWSRPSRRELTAAARDLGRSPGSHVLSAWAAKGASPLLATVLPHWRKHKDHAVEEFNTQIGDIKPDKLDGVVAKDGSHWWTPLTGQLYGQQEALIAAVHTYRGRLDR
ncbi:MAG: hypothetical protein HOQ05_02715 [Corynebacteriales bacterium]|nr:hypothetical protein [Mycobacteriales bacterium]